MPRLNHARYEGKRSWEALSTLTSLTPSQSTSACAPLLLNLLELPKMLLNSFRMALLAAAGLVHQVLAGEGMSHPLALLGTILCLRTSQLMILASADAQQPIVDPPSKYQGWDVIQGVLMDECDDKISVCGKIASVKVEYEHVTTSYITNVHVVEEVSVCLLPIAP